MAATSLHPPFGHPRSQRRASDRLAFSAHPGNAGGAHRVGLNRIGSQIRPTTSHRGSTTVPTAQPTVFKNVCPLDCPDTCSMRVTVRDGVAVELRGRRRPPVHARVPLPEDGPLPRPGLQPRPADVPAEAGRAEGRGAVRADPLGRGARRRSPTGSRRSPARPTGRRRSCPTAITARWASSSRAASTGGSSTGWAPRSSTGRSAPRPASLGYEYTLGRGRLGRRPAGRAAVQVHRQLGLEHRQHQQPPLEPDDRGPQGRRDDRHRSTPTGARPPRRSDWHIQPRPGTDAALALGLMHVIWRDGLQDDDYLAPGHGRRRPAPRARASTSIRPTASPRSPASTSTTIETLRPPPGPRAALADPPQLRPAAPSRRRDGRADDRLPARDRRLLAAPRRRGPALDQRHLRLRHGPADPPRPLARPAPAPST